MELLGVMDALGIARHFGADDALGVGMVAVRAGRRFARR